MPEWSKGDDLRSSIHCMRGFKPHSRHFSASLYCCRQSASTSHLCCSTCLSQDCKSPSCTHGVCTQQIVIVKAPIPKTFSCVLPTAGHFEAPSLHQLHTQIRPSYINQHSLLFGLGAAVLATQTLASTMLLSTAVVFDQQQPSRQHSQQPRQTELQTIN